MAIRLMTSCTGNQFPALFIPGGRLAVSFQKMTLDSPNLLCGIPVNIFLLGRFFPAYLKLHPNDLAKIVG